MVNIPKERCCGCGACEVICPKSAIHLTQDNCTYLYPHVDHVQCINCNLCDKVCPELNTQSKYKPINVYAAKGIGKNFDAYKNSASGGAATIFGQHILESGGIVYGCSQLSYKDIKHIRIKQTKDLPKIQNSKYVQSDIRPILKDVQYDLKAGLTVLFIGTPCQISALYGFLQKPYENLLTVDLVCHGVPPQGMLQNYIDEEIRSYNVSPEQVFVNFRWKTQYGIQFGIQFGIHDRILKSTTESTEPYMRAFLSNLSLRESCYHCRYATKDRISDITIGDFWGLGKDQPSNLNAQNGVSVIMINTSNGNALWAETSNAFTVEKRTYEEAAKENRDLHAPQIRPGNRDLFLNIYQTHGLRSAIYKCDKIFRRESLLVVRIIRKIHIIELVCQWGLRKYRKVKS